MPTQLQTTASSNRLFTFDFASVAEFVGGDTITGTPVMGCCPTGLTFGTPAVVGSSVNVRISGGTAGQNYQVTCKVVTAGGSTIYGAGYLLVTPDCES